MARRRNANKSNYPRIIDMGKISFKLTSLTHKWHVHLNFINMLWYFQSSGYPLYWKCPVFQAAGGEKAETISLIQLTKAWRRLGQSCHDDAAQFIAFLTQATRNYLVPEDFVPLIQDVVDTHPGLLFLKEATEFHSRYVHTVSQFEISHQRNWKFILFWTAGDSSYILRSQPFLEWQNNSFWT